MSRRKAGVCACQHEIGYWHDKKTGRCMYGSGLNGAGEPHPPKSIAGGCGCVRKMKTKQNKKMNVRTKQITRAVTVDGDRITKALRTIRGAHLMIAEELDTLLAELARGKIPKEVPAMLDDAPQNGAAVERPRVRPIENGTAAAGARTLSPAGGADSELGAGPRAVLTAIALWGAPTAEVLVVATGYRSTSVQTYLGELASRALITRENGISCITGDGLLEVGDPIPPKPTKKALLERWISDLPEGPSTVLRAIAEAPGAIATPSQLVDATPYKHTSIQTYLGELANAKVIKRGGGRARLHPELGGPL